MTISSFFKQLGNGIKQGIFLKVEKTKLIVATAAFLLFIIAVTTPVLLHALALSAGNAANISNGLQSMSLTWKILYPLTMAPIGILLFIMVIRYAYKLLSNENITILPTIAALNVRYYIGLVVCQLGYAMINMFTTPFIATSTALFLSFFFINFILVVIYLAIITFIAIGKTESPWLFMKIYFAHAFGSIIGRFIRLLISLIPLFICIFIVAFVARLLHANQQVITTTATVITYITMFYLISSMMASWIEYTVKKYRTFLETKNQ